MTYQQLCEHLTRANMNGENLDAPAAFAQVAAIDTLHDVPMTVITATSHPRGLAPTVESRLDEVWRRGQEHWVSLSSSARLVAVDDTGHTIQVDQPGVVIAQIDDLLR